MNNRGKQCDFDEKVEDLIFELEKYTRRMVSENYQTIIENMQKVTLFIFQCLVVTIHDSSTYLHYDALNFFQKANIIDVALNKNLNAELAYCRKNYSPCRVTGEFAIAIKDGIKFINYIANVMKGLPESIPIQINVDEVSQSIKETIIQPVNECLEN